MEREFCSYEQALALQELGCGVIMNYKYWRIEKNILVFHDNYNMQFIIDKGFDVECLNVYAPLKQQVFRWFREKYGLQAYLTTFLEMCRNDGDTYHVVVGGSWYPQLDSIDYEKAENAAIDKLIERAKQQKK